MRQWPALIAAAAMTAAPASAGVSPFGAPALPDADLAATTGGFSTPLGIDVNFTIEINTRIDGQLALRSVMKPGIDPVTVYVPPITPPTVNIPPVNLPAVNVPVITPPALNIEVPRLGGLGNTPPSVPAIGEVPRTPVVQDAAPAVNVTFGQSAEAGIDPDAAAHIVLPSANAETAIESRFGNVTIAPSRTGPQVVLAGPDIEVRHMLGQATTVIANVANDRVIDTTTIVQLELPSVQGLALGSALSRIEDALRRD